MDLIFTAADQYRDWLYGRTEVGLLLISVVFGLPAAFGAFVALNMKGVEERCPRAQRVVRFHARCRSAPVLLLIALVYLPIGIVAAILMGIEAYESAAGALAPWRPRRALPEVEDRLIRHIPDERESLRAIDGTMLAFIVIAGALQWRLVQCVRGLVRRG